MEALTAVSVALLTIYDMAKALDKAMVDRRHPPARPRAGGKSGDWRRRGSDDALLPVARGAAPALLALAPRRCRSRTVPLAAAARPLGRRRRRAPAAPSPPPICRRWTAMRSASPTCPARGASIGESAAGPPVRRHRRRGRGGAHLHRRGDARRAPTRVLVQEEAARDGDRLTLAGEGPPAPGRNIRRRGLDFADGRRADRGGRAAHPGAARARGDRRPRHAARPPPRPRRASPRPATNWSTAGRRSTDGSAARIQRADARRDARRPAGRDRSICGILPDDLDAHAATPSRAVDADLLVTTGGASVGDHDLVRPALEAAGGSIDFWRVAIRPGKPMLAGRLGRRGGPRPARQSGLGLRHRRSCSCCR